MIPYYNDNTKMSDIICDAPQLLQMMSRFGVPLGVGDRSVREVCEAGGVDTPTFLAVANFMRHGTDSVSKYIDAVSVSALVTYLSNAHDYFLDFQLPAIRRKLIEAIDIAHQNDVALLILKFYDEYMGEVRHHMEYENRKIFTYVERLLAGTRDEMFEIAHFARNHSSINKKLQELKNIIIKYYVPTDNGDLLNNVLFDIFNCEADLRSHCALENDLFIPAVALLEEQVIERGNSEEAAAGLLPAEDVLSDREKEIIGCIVRGMTNKEVAAHLFISINTVLTHRKNISRKLDIHSVSGLTIYAIAGGLVDVKELGEKIGKKKAAKK